ncbi:MAG: acyltransferase [Cytophagaceae bacterium]|jgi:peptidoglycan/LPS O-acetylase OafA/YrhL|nr:acyltransferase [Cytophagaceae bacterium]
MTTNRLEGLDFLRGISILGVILFHLGYLYFGWVGVECFFILSGFLIAQLLCKEYAENKKIKPFRFLIRRGFKIYPLYYLFILFTYLVYDTERTLKMILGDLFFIRNYLGGSWAHTWSICVEEHFYLLIAFILWIASSKDYTYWHKIIPKTFLFFILTPLILRTVNYYGEIYWGESFLFGILARIVHTHNRIDSLFCGALLGYYYTFFKDAVFNWIVKFKGLLFIIIIIGLYFILTHIRGNLIYDTIGYSFLNLFFGVLLLLLLKIGTHERYAFWFKNPIYLWVSRLGTYSYVAYLIHIPIIQFIHHLMDDNDYNIFPPLLALISVFVFSWLISKYVEQPILRYRNQHYK